MQLIITEQIYWEVVSQKSLCFQPLSPLYESKPPYASATPNNVL